MKFKMAPNSLFAILLRNPWWCSFVLVAVICAVSAALLPKEVVVFGVIGAFPFVVTGGVALKRQWNKPSTAAVEADMARIAGLSWRDFSRELEAKFAAQGYEILRPEDHKMAAQVAMFRAASHVVGTEGSPFHLLAMAAQSGCKVAVIQRRRSPTFGQICQHLETFIGGSVCRIDAISSVHAPRKLRNPNLIYLETNRPAMWAALAADGFVGGDPWTEMSDPDRKAAVAWLEKETEKTLRPMALEDLPEDDGDEEKDAA